LTLLISSDFVIAKINEKEKSQSHNALPETVLLLLKSDENKQVDDNSNKSDANDSDEGTSEGSLQF